MPEYLENEKSNAIEDVSLYKDEFAEFNNGRTKEKALRRSRDAV